MCVTPSQMSWDALSREDHIPNPADEFSICSSNPFKGLKGIDPPAKKRGKIAVRAFDASPWPLASFS